MCANTQIAPQRIPSHRNNISCCAEEATFSPEMKNHIYVYKLLSSEWQLIRFCGSNMNDLIYCFFSSAEPPGFAEVRTERMGG